MWVLRLQEFGTLYGFQFLGIRARRIQHFPTEGEGEGEGEGEREDVMVRGCEGEVEGEGEREGVTVRGCKGVRVS
jgi:hypothetical protein